jgi:hypothetical protein
MVRRDDRDDDSRRGPRPREDVQRSSRVRQLFPGCSSERAVCVRTRSPPTYRQALERDLEAMDRGRTLQRSPARSGRERDYLAHATEEWQPELAEAAICFCRAGLSRTRCVKLYTNIGATLGFSTQ